MAGPEAGEPRLAGSRRCGRRVPELRETPRRRWSLGRSVQVGASEAVEIAIEDPVRIAHLEVGAMVLDHRVGMQDIGPNLRAEVHVLGLPLLACDLLAAPALLELDQLGAQ